MFLGSDKYKHEDHGVIKKCSQCNDTNLRFLGLWFGWQGLPLWICGNGHIVYPFYDDVEGWYTYVIYEGGVPSFLIDGPYGIASRAGGVGDYNCCDIPKSGLSKNVTYPLAGENSVLSNLYPCNIPNQLKIDLDGVKGVVGGFFQRRHALKPFCKSEVSRNVPIERNQPWEATCCGNKRANGPCHGNVQFPNFGECIESCAAAGGDPMECIYYGCQDTCTEASNLDDATKAYYSIPFEYWPSINYGINQGGGRNGSIIPNDVRKCGNWPVCDCWSYYDVPYQAGVCEGGLRDCFRIIKLPPCHECGTLRCSNENSKYRLGCSQPDKHFTYLPPGLDNLDGSSLANKIYSIPHSIEFIECDGFLIFIPWPYTKEFAQFGQCGKKLADAYDNNPGPWWSPNGQTVNPRWLEAATTTYIKQPHCLRNIGSNSQVAYNTDDISNQSIILDRIWPSYNDTMWTTEEEKGRDDESNQAYINKRSQDLGSNIEPELVAIIHTASGVGGQIAFQTWPVSFDSDTVIEETNDSDDVCKRYRRPKEHGYGVMYPFIDDPIWKEDYNFPVFLPGMGYKVGERIEFKFWQTLDGKDDPSAGEIFREVVVASGIITEVDVDGGIIWYEFSGDPITGDCPCTKDDYCGALSKICYPEEHPSTIDGLDSSSFVGGGGCSLGQVCETFVPDSECDLGGTFFYRPGDCWPHKRPWEVGGNYGISSCSGVAESGFPSYYLNGSIIPGKADKYYYSWLPDPECFLSVDPFFLEYLAIDQYFSEKPDDYNGKHFPGCSPLIKVWYDAVTGGYDITTRFPDYRFSGPPCRKEESSGDSDTLFVAYQGGSGDVVSTGTGIITRTNDNYCRVYGFYQQKQYLCNLAYEGEFIIRASNAESCDPLIGSISMSFERREAKTDITVSAPVSQDYLLTEYLPAPVSGTVKASFPFNNASVEKWQMYDPAPHSPDPRNNCQINLKTYFTTDQVVYDCDESCIFEGYEFIPESGWIQNWNCSTSGYRDYTYIDVFGEEKIAWRNNFKDLCGYPWENTCKPKINEDFQENPEQECFIDENGELICDSLQPDGSFEDVQKEACDPYCMLKNISAVIGIKEIDSKSGCANSSNLITGDNRYFNTKCFGTVNYTYRIKLTGTDITVDPNTGQDNPSGFECKNYGGFEGNENSFILFVFGDEDIALDKIDEKVEEYLEEWEQRYVSLGRDDLPGWRALYPSEPDDYPVDYNYDMFFSKLFEIDGVGAVKVLSNICDMINYLGCRLIGGIVSSNTYIQNLFGEKRYSDDIAGSIKSMSILNPGNGYAFEVEERAEPRIIDIPDLQINIESEQKNLRRKEESWTLKDYQLDHTGINIYESGQTIPLIFADKDASRSGVVYKSFPTLVVTKVNETGRIEETEILNSGEYYKWIKTGEHRAYPITISVNNYWEARNGTTALGRHAEFLPEVDVRPSSLNETGILIPNPNYGRIIGIEVTNGGIDYYPNGKYWKINTSFSAINLEHLVDECKYGVGIRDPLPVIENYASDNANRYVAPSTSMNGGKIIKWKDKAKSWTTVVSTASCPIELMDRTYSMALVETLQLLQGYCAGSECSEIVDSNTSPPEFGYNFTKSCNRWTGFYGDAFPIVNTEGGTFMDEEAGGFSAFMASLGLISTDATENLIDGCDYKINLDTPRCDLGTQAIKHGGYSNSADPCNGGNEYTILPAYPCSQNSCATHIIYKIGGTDITMKVTPM